ncbi:MAG: hypothetical protein E2603_03195 [Achromobacter sp.]|nr:hypothetical protein [Achromobacter sp.]
MQTARLPGWGSDPDLRSKGKMGASAWFRPYSLLYIIHIMRNTGMFDAVAQSWRLVLSDRNNCPSYAEEIASASLALKDQLIDK